MSVLSNRHKSQRNSYLIYGTDCLRQNKGGKHKMVSLQKLSWQNFPIHILETIFDYLPLEALRSTQATCQFWKSVTRNEYLWNKRFRRDFKVAADKEISIGSTSWIHEYKRLLRHVPFVKVEQLKFEHRVNSVEFSPDGKKFTTSTRDGLVKIWRSDYPVQKIAEIDMKEYGWYIPTHALFNRSNTLLYIFGFTIENEERFGQSAVFSIEGDKLNLNFILKSEVLFLNGTWFCDNYILSEDLTGTQTDVTTSTVYLLNANSKCDVIFHPIFKLRGTTQAPIFHLLMANCSEEDAPADNTESYRNDEDEQLPFSDKSANNVTAAAATATNLSCFYNKLLIYTSCLTSSYPHSIAIKRFRNMEFFRSINPDLTIEEILRFRAEHPVDDTYDTPDIVIDLNANIINIKLCPNNRYLFINSRKFVNSDKNRTEDDEFREYPMLAFEIDFHTIDLRTFEITSAPLHGLQAYSQGEGVPRLTLSVSKNYIVSGSEFGNGYIWDRHYNISVSRLEADGLMDILVFNPTNQEMLITNISEKIIQVYRSREEVKRLNPKPKLPLLKSLFDFPPLK